MNETNNDKREVIDLDHMEPRPDLKPLFICEYVCDDNGELVMIKTRLARWEGDKRKDTNNQQRMEEKE